MKTFAMMLAAVGIATTAVPATANAQSGWVSINQRQANLDRRIDQGVRSGALNRPEARRLRVQLRDLAALENRYRRTGGGLSFAERRELNQRFDRLSQRIYTQKRDRQFR